MRKLLQQKCKEEGKREDNIHRKVYLDILRIIAIVGVFFNHTGYEGIHYYLQTDNKAEYWFGIFLVSVSQYCVPLFFMITGALLLKKEESIAYVYRHRVIKMVMVTALVVLGQYYYNYRCNPLIGFDGKTYFRIVYEGGAITQHWFLYAYISFLLVLPYLQRLVKTITDNRWFLYLFLLYEVINDFLPILAHRLGWGNAALELPMFQQTVICSMMGYYLECCSENLFEKGRNCVIMLTFSGALTAAAMYMNHITIPVNGMARYGSCFVLVYGTVIFTAVRKLCQRWRMPDILKKMICFGGGGVFGAYLIERQLQDFFGPIYDFLNNRVGAYPAVFMQITISVLAGILISNLLKKIPIAGKLL